MRCRTAQKAFTLIEMLVSLAIVGAIVTMVYGSYAATSKSLDTYGDRMACAERAHLALRMMVRQIRCAYMTPEAARPTPGKTQSKTTSAEPTAAFRAGPQGLRDDFLSFLTTGGFGLGLDGPMGISRVAYRYDGSRATLSIRCEPGTDSPSRIRDSAAWRPLLHGVASIEAAFFDGRQWRPTWDSRETGRLPQAVRIALAVADEKGREHRFATAVPIACHGAPRNEHVKTRVKQP